jgi:hypothetical protein
MMAQRLLVERRLTTAIPALVALTADQTVDELGLNPGALHALWTLQGLGAVGSNAAATDAVRKALYHPAASVRRAALMILPRDAALIDALSQAGIVPDRMSPWPVEYTVSSALLQDADPHVRLEALLTLSEAPASPKIAATVVEMLAVGDNARDPWIPDAIAIVGAKYGTEVLNSALQRRGPSDTAALTGIARAVNLMASSRAAATDAGLVPVVIASAQTHPIVARALLQGVASAWPEERAPALTAEQRSALTATARALITANPVPAGGGRGGRGGAAGAAGGGGRGGRGGGPQQPFAQILAQLGERWGIPGLAAQ